MLLLWRVDETTTSTNSIVKPLVETDQAKRDKLFMDHMKGKHEEQLRYYHDHPEEFDELYLKLKAKQK